MNISDVTGSSIPYDFVRRGINRMLLSVTEDEAERAFDGAHPLGYGDNTDYFTDRLARFLIRYGARHSSNGSHQGISTDHLQGSPRKYLLLRVHGCATPYRP